METAQAESEIARIHPSAMAAWRRAAHLIPAGEITSVHAYRMNGNGAIGHVHIARANAKPSEVAGERELFTLAAVIIDGVVEWRDVAEEHEQIIAIGDDKRESPDEPDERPRMRFKTSVKLVRLDRMDGMAERVARERGGR